MGNEKSGDRKRLVADVREQVLFLKDLGVAELSVDLPEVKDARRLTAGARSIPDVGRSKENAKVERAAPPDSLNSPKRSGEVSRDPGSRLSALPSLKDRRSVPIDMAAAARIDEIMPSQNAAEAKNGPDLIDISQKLEETSDTIESIRAEIGDCTRCKLHKLGRTQIVHTTGNFQADLMFVGEAPGADEDEQGFPFVGRAGKLLTDIIIAMGFAREQVAIGNINRCRPPGNRKPEPDETAQCRPFLLREIAVIKPKVIVVLGATAAHNLLQITTPISRLRGDFQDYFGVKVMPTFHPAYLLRDPHKKKDVWEDMKKVRDLLSNSRPNNLL